MEKKKVLKNKVVLRFKRSFASLLSAAIIAGGAVSFVACQRDVVPDENHNAPYQTEMTAPTITPLPTRDELNDFFKNYIEDAGTKYASAPFYEIDAHDIHRLASTGEPIEIGVGFSATDVQKKILQSTIDEYNEFFKVVNPNYHFKLNLENSQNALIKIQFGNKNDVSNQVEDISDSIDGEEIIGSTITLDKNSCDKAVNFNGTLKSLLIKSMGGIEYRSSPSIMYGQNDPYGTSKLTKNDMLMLSQLYKNSSVNQKSVEDYIEAASKSEKYSYDQLCAELSAKKLYQFCKKSKK